MKHPICIFMLMCTVLIFGLVAGCSYGRNHPTKPRSEWRNDHAECERIVRTAIRESPTGFDVPANEIKLTRECMKKKGWR